MRNWRMFAAAGLSLALMAGAAHAERRPQPVTDVLETVVTLKVDGQVTIDTEGRVADYRIDTPLVAALRASVERSVLAWRFRPVLIDGVPRRASAKMRITLVASENAGGYTVGVDNVIFPGTKGVAVSATGAPKDITGRKLLPPRYPLGLMRSGVGGTVLLAIRVNSEGAAADVAAVQTMLLNVGGKQSALQLAVALMEKSALDAARQWTFNLPPGQDAASASRRIVYVPVEYKLDRIRRPKDGSGLWSTVVRTPQRKHDWIKSEPGTQAVGVADIDEGEFVQVASALSLESDVIGRAL